MEMHENIFAFSRINNLAIGLYSVGQQSGHHSA
jgi:hypothetical protein